MCGYDELDVFILSYQIIEENQKAQLTLTGKRGLRFVHEIKTRPRKAIPQQGQK
jgi:hypothetical protein